MIRDAPEARPADDAEGLVLALAKTFHWAGLYGAGHPVLARRAAEVHAALLARLPSEPGGQLVLGIARDKVLDRERFLGEGQELVGRLTEALYLSQVATVGFDGEVTADGLLALLHHLHVSRPEDAAVPVARIPHRGSSGGIRLLARGGGDGRGCQQADTSGKARDRGPRRRT